VLLAHFSDIHLLALRGVRAGAFFNKRLTGALNLLLNRGGQFPISVARALLDDIRGQAPGHVILSGDLTNLALPAEFSLVQELLAEFGLSPLELTVVPGNHDCYLPPSVREETFGEIMRPFLQGELQPNPGGFPLVRLREGLAVVALSTGRPSAPLLAVGSLGVRQIWMAEQLLDHEECRRRFRLVVLHHPPLGPHTRWHNRLTDRRLFLEMLERVGAELVVHGHLHRFLRRTVPGPAGEIPVIGAGSGTWIGARDPARRAQYNLYQIEGGRLTRVRRRRYLPRTRRFEEMEV
jgi:3',5'-cyclic AMP phosphodiesterase CpdA